MDSFFELLNTFNNAWIQDYEPVQAPPSCCKISSIGLAHCPTLSCDLTCRTQEIARTTFVQIMYCIIPVLSWTTHALCMGYEHVGSVVDGASGSINIAELHSRNIWIVSIMTACVIVVTLSAWAILANFIDILCEAGKCLHDCYKAFCLMSHHFYEGWRYGFKMVPPFMGFLTRILWIFALFVGPSLFIFDIYVSGVGRELWQTVATLALNISGLLVWFLKKNTGWDVLSKVMSVFRNPRLQVDFESLDAALQNVTPVRSTVPAANTTAPLQDIQAQLRELQRRFDAQNQWVASN